MSLAEFFLFSSRITLSFPIIDFGGQFLLEESFFFKQSYIWKRPRINPMTHSPNWFLQMHSNKERHNLNSKQENWRESSGYRI